MSDRLAELFASKPLSYTGAGISYAGDASGHAVTLPEQGLVIRRNVNDNANAATARQPLQLYANGSLWSVYPGTVLGVMPTISGTALNAGTPPTLSVPGSGTRHVVLNISGTPNTTTLAGRVFFHPAMSSIAVTVTLVSTAPTGADLIGSSGTFKLLLATFVDGVKTLQNGFGPISGYVQDQLDGSGNGSLQLTYYA